MESFGLVDLGTRHSVDSLKAVMGMPDVMSSMVLFLPGNSYGDGFGFGLF